MTDLPTPRQDGFCCVCLTKPAVTRDGRFCKRCLSEFVRELNPTVRDLSRPGTEAIGRPAITVLNDDTEEETT